MPIGMSTGETFNDEFELAQHLAGEGPMQLTPGSGQAKRPAVPSPKADPRKGEAAEFDKAIKAQKLYDELSSKYTRYRDEESPAVRFNRYTRENKPDITDLKEREQQMERRQQQYDLREDMKGRGEGGADIDWYFGKWPEKASIDRDHHVPLLASAILDKEGNMTGMAVDHRIPPGEHEQFWLKHEGDEARHMKDLTDAGMAPNEAYDKAHAIATTLEHDAVRAHAIRTGRDPDAYLEKHKQFGRDAARIASEPTDRPRHPDAHTTRYGLDEAELGPSPFEDVGKYIPKGPTGPKPEPSPALKFWEHPSPKKVIPIREG